MQYIYMWQSQVTIIPSRILMCHCTQSTVSLNTTSVMDGSHMHYVEALQFEASTHHV